MPYTVWCRCLCVALLAVFFAEARHFSHLKAQEAADSVKSAKEAAKSTAEAIRVYRSAVALQNRESFDLAADEWAAFLKDHGGDPLAGKARHYLGVCLLQQKKYADAAAAFEKAQASGIAELEPASRLYLGLSYYQLGRGGDAGALEKAGQAFDKLLKQFPDSKQAPQALMYLGESYYAAKQLDEAAKAYNALMDKFPKDPLVQEALFALGVALQEKGDSPAAKKALERFTREFAESPRNIEASMRLGEVLLAEGEFEQARARLERAASAGGFELADHALTKLAELEYRLKHYEQAAQLHLKLRENFPKSRYAPDSLIAAANCYYLANAFDKAEPLLTQIISSGQEHAAEACHWKAKIFLKQGKPEDAAQAAENGLRLAGSSPFQVELLLDQADAAADQKNSKKAVELYQAIVERFPQDALAPQALYLAAYTALQSKDYKAALRLAGQFQNSFAGHERAADVQYISAEADLLTRQYEKAAAAFEALLTTFPKRPESSAWRIRRLTALQLLGRHDQVVAALTNSELLNDDAQGNEARFILASSLLEQGERAESEKLFKSAIKQPDASPARKAEIQSLLARIAKENGDPAAAVKAMRSALEQPIQEDDRNRAQLRLAEYLYESGSYSDALNEYAALLGSNSLEPEVKHGVLLGAGWAAAQSGDNGKAEVYFERLLQSAPSEDLAAKGRYARAVTRQRNKNFSGALEDLAQYDASPSKPTSAIDVDYLRGLCLVGLEKHAEAADVFKRAVEANPDYHSIDKLLYELAWAYKNSGKTEPSTDAFRQLFEKQSQSPLAAESALHVAEAKYDAKEYAQAADWYSKAQEAHPDDAVGERSLHKLAWTKYQQEDYQAAADAFAAQLEKFPSGTWASEGRFMQAESLFAQKSYEQAAPVYKQVLAKLPKREEFAALAPLHAAQTLAQQKEWNAALQVLEQFQPALKKSAWLEEAMYEKAWCLQNLGRSDDAITLFDEVGSSDSEIGARAHFMLGEIRFERGDHREAIRSFFKAAYGYGYPKWQADSLFEAGRCFEVMKNVDQAKKCYEEVVEKFPQSDKVAGAKERLTALAGR